MALTPSVRRAGFTPNARTYLFFGKRGSGKTTIRVQMEQAYQQYIRSAVAADDGERKPFFMVTIRLALMWTQQQHQPLLLLLLVFTQQ